MPLITLNLEAPKTEKRSALENPAVPLSAALAQVGWGSVTDSNEVVSEQSSLQVPTVLACIRILSEGVGSLPLRVYEELERGRRLAKSHYLYRTLGLEPNPETTAVTLLSTLMTHAALWQNAYCEVERNTAGQAVALWPRLPWRTRSVRQAGRLLYETTDTDGGARRLINADDMVHIVGFSLDALTGSSLIGIARQSIGLALVAAKYGGRFYANGARPGFVIELAAPLSPEDMTRLRQDLETMTTGINAHRIAVLAPGMKAVELAIDPVQAEYVATRRFEREEIAAVFRVPGYMVGASEKVLKSTIEAQNMEFLTYSLRPWIERFEQEFNRKLLSPVGRNSGKFSIHFFTDALLSVDKATRTNCYTQGRNGGWLSINDIRESEGMQPIDGGDDYLQPLNMQKVSSESDDVETLDEPDPSSQAARAKEQYLPIIQDALGRIQHRAKHDSTAFRQCLLPVIASMSAHFRMSEDAGTQEQEASEKYLRGFEERFTKHPEAVTPEDEYRRLVRSLVFAIEADRAEARSKRILQNE